MPNPLPCSFYLVGLCVHAYRYDWCLLFMLIEGDSKANLTFECFARLCTSSSPLRSQEAHLQHLERPRGDPHTAVHPAPAGEVQRHRHRPRVQLRPEGVQQSGVFGPRPVCR